MLCALAVAVASFYLARRLIAREVLVGWLEARGARADVDIERLDLRGIVARVRVGASDDPDFAVERVEVDYGLRGFWSPRGLGADIRRVRLVRPVLRASLHDGVLSLGSLDRIVEELRKQPPEPDATKPLVLVDGARARLDTDYGLLAVQADARIEDAKLVTLTAKLGPTALSGEDLKAEIAGGTLSLATQGDRVDLDFRASATSVALGSDQAHGVQLKMTGQGPYPDLERRRGDGALNLVLSAKADDARLGEVEAKAMSVNAQFEGQAAGWVDTLSLAGPVRASLAATQVNAPSARLSSLDGGFAGQARWSKASWRAQGTTSATLRGSWDGLGAPSRDDPAELAALKHAVADFRLAAPAVALAAGPDMLQVGLPAPLRVTGANGVQATLSARAGKPLLASGSGAFDLALSGGGVPHVTAAVERYALAQDGGDARLAASADGSFGPVRDAKLHTAGALALHKGVLTYAAAGCEGLEIARLDFGANDARAIQGELCPVKAPLLRVDEKGWSTNGRVQAAQATAPFLEARGEDVAASFSAKGRGGAVELTAQLDKARLIDTAEAVRFHPVSASGDITLKADRWNGEFNLADKTGHSLGHAVLDHDMVHGTGGVRLDTGDLAFAPEGLQPVTLSPMAAMVASPVVGHARFEGGVRWAGEALTSDGVLSAPSLDFKSLAGPVVGLSGEVRFTSLVPLETAPDQKLKVDHIESMASLTHASLDFQIVDDLLKITSGDVEVGGGFLRLEPMSAPLDGSAFEGALEVDKVQLADIVAKSPFADRVSLEAKVSGWLPFVLGPDGIRFINGRLEAVEPGRLSIRREALVTVASGGGEATVANAPQALAPDTNTVTEFAFQALEHLAFDSLSAEVNSLPEGRLGVLFKILGAYEPPQEQSLELGLRDLLRKDLLQRRLPLPSHTKVNLTLDTTLNLDQLLHDFAETQRAGSGSVQP